MPSLVRSIPLVAALLTATVLTACTAAQIRMPEGFASNAQVYDVSGNSPRRHNQPMRFGPYSALEMREGGTLSWGFPIGKVDVINTRQRIAFTLVALNQNPVEVQCLKRSWAAEHGHELRRLEIDLTAVAGPLMNCGLRMESGDVLALNLARSGNYLKGHLASPWGDFAIRSVHGFNGSPFTTPDPTGFEISRGGITVAVVDVLNAGRVHFDRDLSESQKTFLAAAASALLMEADRRA
jgi:hypothetical protein